MKQTRKVISGAGLTAYEQWELPVVADNATRDVSVRDIARPMTASELEKMHKQAYEDGFARGRQEGKAKGYREGRDASQAEARDRIQRLDGILACLTRPLEELDQQVQESLVSLALAVARHLVRRELKADPRQVIGVVREAVSALPVAARDVRIQLHPEDAALVRELLAVREGESTWRIEEDPVLSRGGCRVMTEVSQIDATVENRVAQVIARVLGEEREAERAT